jgi:hypothetical protein
MIKINKRPLPSGVVIARESDYRGGIVFKMLVEDCRGKCYLCEDSVHTAPNVEHRVSHQGNSTLKYDWNNLFLSCSHCNNTKLEKFDGIIDPATVDPEKFIEISLDIDEELREVVVVRKLDGGTEVDMTVSLLDAVYNGVKTDMKKYACRQLKNKISNELSWFRKNLDEYMKNPCNAHKTAIENKLAGDSVFAAFKRKIIKDHLGLSREFLIAECE